MFIPLLIIWETVDHDITIAISPLSSLPCSIQSFVAQPAIQIPFFAIYELLTTESKPPVEVGGSDLLRISLCLRCFGTYPLGMTPCFMRELNK